MKFYTNVFIHRGLVYYSGYEFGNRVRKKINYKPYIFLSSAKHTGFKTLNGEHVQQKFFNSISSARKYIKEYNEVDNFHFYGLTNFAYTWINDYFEGEIKYNPDLIKVIDIDIEVAADDSFPDYRIADKEITAITVSKNGKKVVFGCGDFESTDKKITYLKCMNEVDLLRKFLVLWSDDKWMPDIITGWNVEFFDIPYLYNRLRVLLGESEANKLSPWGIVEEQKVNFSMRGNDELIYNIKGVSTLDYLTLYKKFSFSNQESYRLDHIASIELNEKKLDYSQYASLIDLYKKNFQLFIEYNIKDVVLVDKLDNKLGFIKQVMALAYDAKVNFNDTLATVKPWDIIIHNYLMNKRIVIPQQKIKSNNTTIVGGYVKDPQVGMHNWVVSFDLNSLYPHLIMQYNISPETFIKKIPMPSIDKLLERDTNLDDTYSTTANGCCYRKDSLGFLPELMQKMYDDRVVYKNLMIDAKKEFERTKNLELQNDISKYHNLQLAKKIQLNSAYGALANQYFRWFDNDIAESITSTGQLTIRWIEDRMNTFMNGLLKTENVDYVIASDTDSIYVNMSRLVNMVFKGEADNKEITQFLSKFSDKKIQLFMDKSYAELAEYMRAYQQKMQMKREAIANKGIWTSKKRYILNVYDLEGVTYDNPKLKIQGIEAIRSSTPASCKDSIREAISIIMNKSEKDLIKFINDFKNKFDTLPVEEIAFPRSMNNLNKYKETGSALYKSGTPIQVRGAILFNHYLHELNMDKKIQPIHNGDKIKFVYLKVPNPIRENVISFINNLPKEFGLHDFINRDLQFEKTFLEPIKNITSSIKWKTDNTVTLEDFF